MTHPTRRDFLQAAAAVTIAGTKSSGRVLGANDVDPRRRRPASTGRGTPTSSSTSAQGRAGHLSDRPGPEPVRVAQKRSGQVGVTRRRACRTSARRWTTRTSTRSRSPPQPLALAAGHLGLQAGKDVYVEKPMSHVVSEGRRCMEAARKYRPDASSTAPSSGATRPGQRNRRRPVRKYGKLLVSKGYCCKPRWSIGHKDRPSRRRTWTSTSGSGRPPSSRTTGTWSITTGTGSGTSATATSATRASTRWTSPAGRSRARRCRPRSGASAGDSPRATRGRRPTCRWPHGVRRRAPGVRGPRPRGQARRFPFNSR